MTEPVAPEVPRQCGPCTACCVSPDINVRELYKKPWSRCPHLSRVGPPCTVYHDRPGVCREFSCAWLQGILPENLRPDLCGFYLEVKENPDLVFFALVETGQNAWKGDGTILNVIAAQIEALRKAGEARRIELKVAMHPSSKLRKEVAEWIANPPKPSTGSPGAPVYEGNEP